MTRVALYLRTSHADRTVENQRQALQDVAVKRGWSVVAEFKDEAISGSKGRSQRPGFDALLKGAVRRDFDMVAAWSVDRLGRSISDLIETLQELNGSGCALYLHQQALDTSSPSGRAMFQMLGVFAEFEREMIRARVKAGLARRAAAGKKLGRQRTPEREAALKKVRAMIRAGYTNLSAVARTCGVSERAARRERDAMAGALPFLA